MGAILFQIHDKSKDEMISEFIKKLDAPQKIFSVTDKKLLGVLKVLEHYKYYLLGIRFTLKTNYKALENI
jgi:RNase H-like domain found in reverse transcriptase